MTGTYGDNWYWSGGPLGTNDALERGRWYQLEMHVVMNTPGSNDGVLEGWVDGQKVFERRDVRFRDVDTLHVERVCCGCRMGATGGGATGWLAALLLLPIALRRRAPRSV